VIFRFDQQFQSFSKRWRLKLTELQVAMIATVTITGLLLGIRQLGGLQAWELVAFDYMLRWRSPQSPDPHLTRNVPQEPGHDLLVAQMRQPSFVVIISRSYAVDKKGKPN
jgi:hypothetical protein